MFVGDVRTAAHGERNAIRDDWSGQVPILHSLGTARLRCSVFCVTEVSYRRPDCIVSLDVTPFTEDNKQNSSVLALSPKWPIMCRVGR